jgi:hypothetical protein
VTEIRQFGASSIQIMRRLPAELESLRASVRAEYVAAVDDELARLASPIQLTDGPAAQADV